LIKEYKGIKQYTRITVSIEDVNQNYKINSANPIIKEYNIFALQPLSEKAYLTMCATLEADIISFDMSVRIGFHVKASTVGQAIARGYHFELNYSNLLKDTIVRRNMISNALSLVRNSHAKNLIVSSGTNDIMHLRGIFDVRNL
jgi:ribonuclease P/MRP protein subunit RPP1